MKDINVVVQHGRLVKDAEFYEIQEGKGWINFTIAVNSSKKVNGIWEDVGNFFNCKQWGSSRLAAELVKGNKVVVSGSLEQDQWSDPDTQQKKSKILIFAQQTSIEYRQVKKDGADGDTAVFGKDKNAFVDKINDDDVPF